MKEYLKYRIWDWLLCTGMATGLVFPIFAGFVLEDAFSSSVPFVILFMAVMTAVLVLFTYTRRTTIAGIIIGVALLVFVMAYVRVNAVFTDETSEATNSLFIALTVSVLVAVFAYLLCRTKPGTIVLFLAGNFLICGSYFLEFESHVWNFLLFEFACIVMLWYRNYMLTLQRVETGQVRVPRFMIQTLLICLIAIVLGSSAWYGIVRPIEPPTRQLKLIEQLKKMNITKVAGLYNIQEYLDPSMETAEDADETNEGTGADEKKNDLEADSNKEKTEHKGQAQNLKTRLEEARDVYYVLNFIKIPYILILIICLIAVALFLRRLARKNWINQVSRMSAEKQVIQYYTFFTSRLARVGYKKAKNHTLYEFADVMDQTMQEFGNGEESFSNLTDIYIKTIYGKNLTTEQEAGLFKNFYQRFYPALRKEIGMFKFIIHIFRL